VEVTCRFEAAGDGQLLASFVLRVQAGLPRVSRHFSFTCAENTIFKHRLDLPGAQRARWYAACSDTEASVQVVEVGGNPEQQGIFLKRAVGPSPAETAWYLLLYPNGFRIQPEAVWAIHVRATEVYSVEATYGEVATASLVVRGNFAASAAACHSSLPSHLTVSPRGSFPLTANALTELSLRIHPTNRAHAGPYLPIFVTLTSEAELLHVFEVRLTVKPPIISKVPVWCAHARAGGGPP
jgi:hypothetical protein